jgi:hypothetical protein
MITLPRIFAAALFVAFLGSMAGCQQHDSHRLLQTQQQAPDKATTVLAVYEAWFGDPDHIKIGYSTQDVVVVEKQMEQAKNMGISGFVVDWYGPRKGFIDTSYAHMQQVAYKSNFKVALMYDETIDDPSRMTEAAISNLDYAYENYIGPEARAHDAYLKYNGHPVIFIWPKGGKTDWSRVREHLQGWSSPPLLIYKDEETPFASRFDGVYAWIHPGEKGWTRDGSNWGEQYLQDFYSRMTAQHRDKIVVGTAWPGFNDSMASWSENRYMDRRCGKTFEDTLHYFRRYYGPDNPLPFLLIATWNDHEEGTAIEQGFATVPDPNNTSKC